MRSNFGNSKFNKFNDDNDNAGVPRFQKVQVIHNRPERKLALIAHRHFGRLSSLAKANTQAIVAQHLFPPETFCQSRKKISGGFTSPIKLNYSHLGLYSVFISILIASAPSSAFYRSRFILFLALP